MAKTPARWKLELNSEWLSDLLEQVFWHSARWKRYSEHPECIPAPIALPGDTLPSDASQSINGTQEATFQLREWKDTSGRVAFSFFFLSVPVVCVSPLSDEKSVSAQWSSGNASV